VTPPILRNIRYWLEDHNPFEDRSIRSARRRLRESNQAYGESQPHVRKEVAPNGRLELTATIKPYPETVEEPSDEVLQEIRAAAAELPYLMQAFLGQSVESWNLEDLDRTFSAWAGSPDKGRFTNEKVIQITGAAFGEYCNLHLNTRWRVVTDPIGTQLGIRTINNGVRAWPHSMVRKRVVAGEHEFFASVYETLRRPIEETYYTDLVREPPML
jgi:hypothetical protein